MLSGPPRAPRLGLYGLADATWGDPWPMAVMLAEAGVGVVQLRCKGWPREAVRALAERCRGLGPRLVINDDAALARELGLDAHLGQDDGPDPPGVPFGRSTHTLEQVGRPGAAWYIGFGPVFSTRTKRSAWSPRGVGALEAAVRASPVPVVAIGGIDLDNLAAVVASGAAGWAISGAIWTQPDPRAALRALQRAGLAGAP